MALKKISKMFAPANANVYVMGYSFIHQRGNIEWQAPWFKHSHLCVQVDNLVYHMILNLRGRKKPCKLKSFWITDRVHDRLYGDPLTKYYLGKTTKIWEDIINLKDEWRCCRYMDLQKQWWSFGLLNKNDCCVSTTRRYLKFLLDLDFKGITPDKLLKDIDNGGYKKCIG